MQKKRKCPECGGEIKAGETTLSYVVNKVNVSVKNVPASVCSGCGLSFLDGHIAEDVNRMVNRVTEDVDSFSKTHPGFGSRQREIAIAV